MSAELAARVTAARAVLADFKRETGRHLDDPARTVPRPDYGMWAWRLSSELGSLLARLDEESAAAAPDGRRRLEQLVANAVERAYQDGLAAAPVTAPETWPYQGEVLEAVGRVLGERRDGAR